jgi:nucleoside-diphosphate-sugar epimerase
MLERGDEVIAVSRSRPVECARWHRADLTAAEDLANLPSIEHLISTVPIWMTAEVARSLAARGMRRVVAFSSTSAITKAHAGDEGERDLAAHLRAGEDALRRLEPEVKTTILRPTMIYGGGGDRNVERIARHLTRVPAFPLVGGGKGRRQPVHAEDLAQAAIDALTQDATAGRVYAVAGGEVLTVREMVKRVADAVDARVWFLPLPLPLAKAGLIAAGVAPRFRGVPPGALERMTKDLVFDHSDAIADFGYNPRPFSPPDYRKLTS